MSLRHFNARSVTSAVLLTLVVTAFFAIRFTAAPVQSDGIIPDLSQLVIFPLVALPFLAGMMAP